MEIWLEFYGYEVPTWIPTFIHQASYESYFLFNMDIAWAPDGLRNNQKDREVLLDFFKRKLNYYNKNWILVSGQGVERVENVLKYIED
jgi:nicotinamide riboside kinase